MNETMNETIPAPAAAALADARAKLQQLGGCALLIGVETYDGLPAEQQLHAGRNDVLAYWKVCRRLGYRHEHIRVLTSPRLGPDDIVRAEQDLGPELHPERSKDEIRALVERWFAGPAPVVLGDASRDAIVNGVEWLASKLVFRVKLDWDDWKLDQELVGLPGLLAYSGHGAHLQGDLALCPSDVGPGLGRAVPFAELRALIDAGDDVRAPGTPHPADNLTVVLDCCFAAAGETGESKAVRVPTLTPGESGPGGRGPVPAPKHEIGSRVFCASGRDEQAYQGVLGGHWHGAFTWAFTRALEQWKTAPSGQFRKSTVSHVELLFRTRMLLEALSFHQHPMLVDRIGNLPVFQHDGDAERGTSAEPDVKRQVGQIDPADGFAYYSFSANGQVLAELVATNTADDRYGTGMAARREYWKVHGDEFKSMGRGDVVVTKVRSGTWPAAGRPPFTATEASFDCPVDQPWSSAGNRRFQYHREREGATRGGFSVNVSRKDGRWSGTMEFYRDTQAGLLFASMTNGSERTLRASEHGPAQRSVIDIRRLISGDHVSLHDTTRGADLRRAYWTSGAYYATSDQPGGAQPQKLTLATRTADGRILSGAEIYIQSTENDLRDWYLRPGGGQNDLWYQGGDDPGQVHTWIIKKYPLGPDGEPIHYSDTVIFLSKEDPGRSMECNTGDRYLSVTYPDTALRPWKIS